MTESPPPCRVTLEPHRSGEDGALYEPIILGWHLLLILSRVILEPHQVEMEHRGKTDKDHPLFRLLEEGSEREEWGGEGERRREAMS